MCRVRNCVKAVGLLVQLCRMMLRFGAWKAHAGAHGFARRGMSTAFQRRVALFEQLKADATSQRNALADTKLRIDCADLAGGSLQATGATRPVELLKSLQPDRAQTAEAPIVVARVNGKLHGLTDALAVTLATAPPASDGSVKLELLRFDSKEGKSTYWHSAAHVLGAAAEAQYGAAAQLCDGPAVLDAEGGFFYEMFLSDGSKITEESYAPLESQAKGVIAARHPFERIAVTAAVAADMFSDNKFKLDMLSRIPADEAITVYRCGPFVDLCRGPHVPHTGYFKALKLFKSSGSHTQPGGELLQRVYGIAFPTTAQLSSWNSAVEEAKRRDHRVVGRAQGLFFFHDVSPGSAFLLPHGVRIYNRLLELLRAEYRLRGYEEVMTPLIFKRSLWRTSGHLAAYAENMFTVLPGMGTGNTSTAAVAGVKTGEDGGCGSCGHDHRGEGDGEGEGEGEGDSILGLKPMNCPSHCIMFAQRLYSYKDLPVRYADFSSLHRNEATGALGGLTRLRRFQQDDAHIFCGEEHIQTEVKSCLDFVSRIYSLFNFSFRMKLSTRPESYVGDIATWNDAEAALGGALRSFLADRATGAGAGAGTGDVQFEVDEGGGAFYGPKIDVFVRDALGREHQCATVQLDFQMPRRFGLSYRDAAHAERTPVIIHRAILGSVERFMAVLIEHTAGKWPFWLSPRQVLVCTVSDRHLAYAQRIQQALQFPAAPWSSSSSSNSSSPQPDRLDSGLWVEIDDTNRTINKKVREGQVAQWNLLAVVGDAEEAAGTVAVRFRDAHTFAAFYKSWTVVDAAAAAKVAPPAPAPAPAASSSGSASSKSGKAQGSAEADASRLPLVVMTPAALRDVCEHMSASKV